jgi:hypothetical protein
MQVLRDCCRNECDAVIAMKGRIRVTVRVHAHPPDVACIAKFQL